MDSPRWTAWEISSVILVCSIFFFLSYYSVLKRLCSAINGTTLPRSLVQRRLLDEANPSDPSLQFHSHGVELSVMSPLPIIQFKNKQGENHINTDCAVCLGEFEEGECLRHLPSCDHVFHVSCIDTWLQSHSNCPLCRSNVYESTMQQEYSISMYTLLETLRRENFVQERAAHFELLRSEILQNQATRQQLSGAS